MIIDFGDGNFFYNGFFDVVYFFVVMNNYMYLVIGEYMVIINVFNCVFNVLIVGLVVVELFLMGVICDVIYDNRDIEVNEMVII